MRFAIFFCLLCAGLITTVEHCWAVEQQPLTEEEAFHLGVDAYVYGYPLLVMDSIRRVSTNVAVPLEKIAPSGQFAHFRSFPDPTLRLAGANLDTLYSLAWLDLSQGPYVLHLPDVPNRFYMMPIIDGWTEMTGNPGTRTTGDKAGNYAITGPEWKGTLPAGVKQIKSGTNMVWLLGRTYTSGTPQDLAAVHAIQDQYTLVPLVLYGRPRQAPARGVIDPSIDMKTPPRDQIDELDAATFFKRLASLMKNNSPTAQDAPMVASLARLGIVDDMDFTKLPSSVAQALSRVPEAARKKIIGHYAKQPLANGWIVTKGLTGSGRYGTDYVQRALIAYVGAGGNVPEDALYPIARIDHEGKLLNGANRYVLHFTKAEMPPIDSRGFWSLTIYDNEYFLVPNPANRYALLSRDKFKRNADGSMDLYVQGQSPGADKQSNWLPTPNGEFILMLRLYWPKDQAVYGSWSPPAVRRVE
jgi:hypothetical protein